MNLVVPPFLHFHIIDESPEAFAPGAHYRYRLKLHGVPVRWKTEITKVDPPHYFEDRQAQGPYASFVHEHFFEPDEAGTLVRDVIRYRPPGWLLAPMVNRMIVRPDLARMFTHRHATLASLYEGDGDPAALLTSPENLREAAA